MIKKIAIIEPFKHYEVLAAILRLVKEEAIEVHCFTTVFCRDQISNTSDNIHFYTFSGERLADDFIEEHLELLNQCSFVFFTTLDIHSKLFSNQKISTKLLGLVHNANNFFFYNNKKKAVDQVKYYFNKLRGDFSKNAQVLNRLDRVVVPTKFIAEYIEIHYENRLNKLKAIEIAIPKHKPLIYNRKEVIITIPGTVNQDRRDYQLIAEKILSVDARIEVPVKLFFLGKLFSKKERKLLEQLQTKKLKYVELVTFEDYVPIDTFREIIALSDFLLLPIQQLIQYKAFEEERGKSCVSGNINDMVQDGLPAILPSFYPLAQELEQMVGRYEKPEGLEDLLVDWISTKHFNKIKKGLDLDDYLKRVKGLFWSL